MKSLSRRRRSVEAGEDKGGPDTAPEQSETQEKNAKGQDGDPNLEEKPVEEKEAETKPVTSLALPDSSPF